MTDYAAPHDRKGAARSPSGRLPLPLLLLLLLIAGLLGLAAAPAAYMLWPRWPDSVQIDAPALPITVGGVVFNVPPATIRVRMQRRPGAQPRIDLVFLWPSLAPPDPAVRPTLAAPNALGERVFVTVAASDGTLPPLERLKIIYPRYVAVDMAEGSDGLVTRAFRNGTPYQGEDLIYDAGAPDRFLLRCTRKVGMTPGMCLHERRVGGADITVRFPREWLVDWATVAQNLDRLIASLRPVAAG